MKIKYLIILFSIVLTLSFAETQTNNSFDAFKLAYTKIILALFALDAVIMGIMYMYGKSVSEASILYKVHSESWQLVLTLALFLVMDTLFLSFNYWFVSYLHYSDVNTQMSIGQHIVTQYQVLEEDIQNKVQIASAKEIEYYIKGSTNSPVFFPVFDKSSFAFHIILNVILCSPTLANFPVCMLKSGFNSALETSILVNVNYPANLIFSNYATIVEQVVIQLTRYAENFLIPCRIIFQFFFTDIFKLLPLMAVTLRVLPWTRDAGNLIFTLTLSFGIIFPFIISFMYLPFSTGSSTNSLSSNLADTVCSNNIPTGSAVPPLEEVIHFGPLTCSGDISIANSVAYYPILIVIPSLALGIASTFAMGFNKMFDYFKG